MLIYDNEGNVVRLGGCVCSCSV